MHEARPWRQYVIEVETGAMVKAIGLTPFNMTAKIAVIQRSSCQRQDTFHISTWRGMAWRAMV